MHECSTALKEVVRELASPIGLDTVRAIMVNRLHNKAIRPAMCECVDKWQTIIVRLYRKKYN